MACVKYWKKITATVELYIQQKFPERLLKEENAEGPIKSKRKGQYAGKCKRVLIV